MKYLVITLFILTALTSCMGPSANAKAESVCECYKVATRGGDRVDVMVDSCTQIYKKALTDLEGDAEGKKQFAAAYDYCRNN